jgi:hypothetical protein
MTIKGLLAIRSAKPDGLVAKPRHDGIEKWLRQFAECLLLRLTAGHASFYDRVGNQKPLGRPVGGSRKELA